MMAQREDRSSVDGDPVACAQGSRCCAGMGARPQSILPFDRSHVYKGEPCERDPDSPERDLPIHAALFQMVNRAKADINSVF